MVALQKFFADILQAHGSGALGNPPKSVDVSCNVYKPTSSSYNMIVHSWARPDFMAAIENAAAREDVEDGLEHFKKTIDYASGQVWTYRKNHLPPHIPAVNCMVLLPDLMNMFIRVRLKVTLNPMLMHCLKPVRL